MAKQKKYSRNQYPDDYGRQTNAIPNILGPLNVDQEGDKLVPRNDMAEVAGVLGEDGMAVKDPLDLVYRHFGDGTKDGD